MAQLDVRASLHGDFNLIHEQCAAGGLETPEKANNVLGLALLGRDIIEDKATSKVTRDHADRPGVQCCLFDLMSMHGNCKGMRT